MKVTEFQYTSHIQFLADNRSATPAYLATAKQHNTNFVFVFVLFVCLLVALFKLEEEKHSGSDEAHVLHTLTDLPFLSGILFRVIVEEMAFSHSDRREVKRGENVRSP